MSTFLATDTWCLGRLLSGQNVNGQLKLVSDGFRPLAEYLLASPLPERAGAWGGFLCGRPDKDELIRAIANTKLDGPVPQAEPVRFATAADVRRLNVQIRWTWEGWIPQSRVIGVAAFEGVGKTRFLLDLARRIFLKLEWPDGQPATFAQGTPTLWICSDGHQDELLEMMAAFRLPDEAIYFPATPDEPYDGTDLDNPDFIKPGGVLETAIATIKPGLVFIDTLTNATRRDLCSQDQMKGLKTPLVRLVQQYKTNIVLSLHLSQQGQALGRRIKGITRTLIHLECPDQEDPSRLRLWVEKSYAKKPPALGVTMKDDGNEYDFTPPAKVENNKGGRPPEKLDKAIAFIVEKLTPGDQKGCEVIGQWEARGENKGTLLNARKKLLEDERLAVDDSKKPVIWHLVKKGQEPGS